MKHIIVISLLFISSFSFAQKVDLQNNVKGVLQAANGGANKINIMSYGADPTGVGDNTTALTNAIAAAQASSNPQNVIQFPSGKFDFCSGQINIPIGITLEGVNKSGWYTGGDSGANNGSILNVCTSFVGTSLFKFDTTMRDGGLKNLTIAQDSGGTQFIWAVDLSASTTATSMRFKNLFINGLSGFKWGNIPNSYDVVFEDINIRSNYCESAFYVQRINTNLTLRNIKIDQCAPKTASTLATIDIEGTGNVLLDNVIVQGVEDVPTGGTRQARDRLLFNNISNAWVSGYYNEEGYQPVSPDVTASAFHVKQSSGVVIATTPFIEKNRPIYWDNSFGILDGVNTAGLSGGIASVLSVNTGVTNQLRIRGANLAFADYTSFTCASFTTANGAGVYIESVYPSGLSAVKNCGQPFNFIGNPTGDWTPDFTGKSIVVSNAGTFNWGGLFFGKDSTFCSAPTYAFTSRTNAGMIANTNGVGLCYNGVQGSRFDGTTMFFPGSGGINVTGAIAGNSVTSSTSVSGNTISSTTTVTAGTTVIANGANGVSSFYYTKKTPVTFATLSGAVTCNGGNEGVEGAVTDSTTVVFNATVTGSGTNHVNVRCNGTNWVVY